MSITIMSCEVNMTKVTYLKCLYLRLQKCNIWFYWACPVPAVVSRTDVSTYTVEQVRKLKRLVNITQQSEPSTPVFLRHKLHELKKAKVDEGEKTLKHKIYVKKSFFFSIVRVSTVLFYCNTNVLRQFFRITSTPTDGRYVSNQQMALQERHNNNKVHVCRVDECNNVVGLRVLILIYIVFLDRFS